MVLAFTYIPIRRSAAAGAVPFVVGYAATFLLTAGRAGEILRGATVTGGLIEGRSVTKSLPALPPDHVAAGWFFHNAHFTPIQVPRATAPGWMSETRPTGGIKPVETVNPLVQADGLVLAAFALPVVLLFATGFLVVLYTDPETWRGSVYTGAAVFLGYAPLALLSALLLGMPTGNGPAVPDLLNAALLTGFTYPFFLGAAGGWAAYVVRSVFGPEETAESIDAMY